MDSKKATGETSQKSEKDEKKAVAGGVAILVVAILFIGWLFFFFNKITQGEVETEWGPRTDTVDFSSLREARDSFTETYYDTREEFERIRREAAQAEADRLRAHETTDFSNSSNGPSGSDPFGF